MKIAVVIGMLCFVATEGSMSPRIVPYGDYTMGCECPSTHVQEIFCKDSLAIKGRVLEMDQVNPRQGPNTVYGMNVAIQVVVEEVYKGTNVTQGEELTIFSSTMCGFHHMMSAGEQYIITANDAYMEGMWMIQRGCNWVEPWEQLTDVQKEGLVSYYNYCDVCEVRGSMYDPMDDYESLMGPVEEDEPIGFCFHNKQMAMRMKTFEDCDNMFSACVLTERGDACEWLKTETYKKCMKRRDDKVRKKAKGKKPKKGKKKNKSRKTKGRRY